MAQQNWFARNPAVAVVIALALLGLALVFSYSFGVLGGGTQQHGGLYFYDLGTQELFAAPVAEIPPLERASGQVAVRARVFACGSCRDKSKHFIGYLESNTDEGKRALVLFDQIELGQGRVEPGMTMADYDAMGESGRRVANSEALDRWFHPSSVEGQALVESVQEKCPSETAVECQP